MVIWSYLLLGTTGSGASIDDVLAPVTELPTPVSAAPADVPVPQRDAAPAPLVERRIDQLDLLAELERLITDKLQPAGRLRLVPVSTMPDVPASTSLPVVELVDSPSRLASTSMLLRFTLTDAERQLGLYAVTFRVQVLADVWVPSSRLAPGTILDGGDLTVREVDLIRESRAVPADRELFGRYEIARATTPDRPLTWNDLAPRSLVRKGAVVDVVANDGLLSVSMKGQATRSGALGEIVVIRNLQSKREFSAEVIDENKVRVHF
jgi:flagella basal body P-ring formation protein FlgA